MHKHKNKFLKIAACLILAVLLSSNIYIPPTHAAETYFTADGGTLNLDEINPSEPDHSWSSQRFPQLLEGYHAVLLLLTHPGHVPFPFLLSCQFHR